jgi:hypothetical protein
VAFVRRTTCSQNEPMYPTGADLTGKVPLAGSPRGPGGVPSDRGVRWRGCAVQGDALTRLKALAYAA